MRKKSMKATAEDTPIKQRDIDSGRLVLRKRKPTHPGEILREDVLPTLRMTQTEFAQRLGVSRLTVSEILHEKRPVSVDMAIRLGNY
jgi:addiction module HigA family antidote